MSVSSPTFRDMLAKTNTANDHVGLFAQCSGYYGRLWYTIVDYSISLHLIFRATMVARPGTLLPFFSFANRFSCGCLWSVLS